MYVIDFGLAKEISSVTRPPLELPPSLAAEANLLAIRHLLWDVQQGLVRHHVLSELPALLVREYQALACKLTEARSASPSAGMMAAMPSPARAVARRSTRPRASPKRKGTGKAAAVELESSNDEDGTSEVRGGQGSQEAALSASPPPPPAARAARCSAALLLVWIVSFAASAAAVVFSPRGLNGTMPSWEGDV